MKVKIGDEWKEYEVEFGEENGDINILSASLKSAIEYDLMEEIVCMQPIVEDSRPHDLLIVLKYEGLFDDIGGEYKILPCIYADSEFLHIRNCLDL